MIRILHFYDFGALNTIQDTVSSTHTHYDIKVHGNLFLNGFNPDKRNALNKRKDVDCFFLWLKKKISVPPFPP